MKKIHYGLLLSLAINFQTFGSGSLETWDPLNADFIAFANRYHLTPTELAALDATKVRSVFQTQVLKNLLDHLDQGQHQNLETLKDLMIFDTRLDTCADWIIDSSSSLEEQRRDLINISKRPDHSSWISFLNSELIGKLTSNKAKRDAFIWWERGALEFSPKKDVLAASDTWDEHALSIAWMSVEAHEHQYDHAKQDGILSGLKTLSDIQNAVQWYKIARHQTQSAKDIDAIFPFSWQNWEQKQSAIEKLSNIDQELPPTNQDLFRRYHMHDGTGEVSDFSPESITEDTRYLWLKFSPQDRGRFEKWVIEAPSMFNEASNTGLFSDINSFDQIGDILSNYERVLNKGLFPAQMTPSDKKDAYLWYYANSGHESEFENAKLLLDGLNIWQDMQEVISNITLATESSDLDALLLFGSTIGQKRDLLQGYSGDYNRILFNQACFFQYFSGLSTPKTWGELGVILSQYGGLSFETRVNLNYVTYNSTPDQKRDLLDSLYYLSSQDQELFTQMYTNYFSDLSSESSWYVNIGSAIANYSSIATSKSDILFGMSYNPQSARDLLQFYKEDSNNTHFANAHSEGILDGVSTSSGWTDVSIVLSNYAFAQERGDLGTLLGFGYDAASKREILYGYRDDINKAYFNQAYSAGALSGSDWSSISSSLQSYVDGL